MFLLMCLSSTDVDNAGVYNFIRKSFFTCETASGKNGCWKVTTSVDLPVKCLPLVDEN